MIVIDPSKGGSNTGVSGNDIIEKDFNLLISKYIYDRLNELGEQVQIIRTNDEYISDEDRANRIIESYGNDSDVVAISNRLTTGNEGAEVIYALRNDDTLAKSITDNLEDAGLTVSKYYQRRREDDTASDYYDIQKDTLDIETIIVIYGNVDNEEEATNLKNNYELYAEAVVKALANYKGIPYSYDGELVDTYIVKSGDSLYSIAQKYSTTVDEIKTLNNLSSNLLSIGQELKIPIAEEENSYITYIVKSGDSLYSISQKYGTTVDEIKTLNNLSSNLLSIGQELKILIAEEENSYIKYIVKSGDSLYSISQKYGTTVDEIKTLNNLSSNLLSIGQELKIPIEEENSYITYIVKSGDSLYSISQKYSTTVDEIKTLNNLSSNLLSIGQELKIPIEEESNYITYIVKSGDSLYSISQKYGTTVDEIKTLNNLSSNLLSIGQELKIPN